ncbi:uncharacterized protein LOC144125340 isoform X2 [Amblyomma americanum]
MFRKKKDVDRHVAEISAKLRHEHEVKIRGFNFAKLYFGVKDYDSAKRHLADYLSVQERQADAHKLMGKIHEAIGSPHEALKSYKTSLDLEHQRDVILRICNIYSCLPVVDRATTQYWLQRAETFFPGHEVVIKLKERMAMGIGVPDRKDMEEQIKLELMARPLDVSLRVKLLKLLLDSGHVLDAYKQAMEAEDDAQFSVQAFYSLPWQRCLVDIFEMCHKDRVNPIDEAFMTKYLLALDQLATLALTKRNSSVTFNISSSPTADTDRHGEQTSLENAISAVELLDCLLAKAHKEKLPPTMAWNFVLQHVTGQLYLHVATLLLKRPLKESYNWQEARSWAAALLLTAYSMRPPSSLSQEGWFLALDSPKRRLHQNVFLRAHHRLSVSGHMLHTLCKSEVDENRWLSNLKEQICMPEVRKKVHRGLFDSEASTSWLLQDPTLDTCAFEFPTFADLLKYDQESQWLHPGSLNHLVWLALQWRTLQDKKLVTSEHCFEISQAQVFEELPLKPSTFDSAELETLSQMDTLAFLEATCFCADQSLERGSLRLSKGPLSLPPQAGLQLCTESQANWWSAAYHQSMNNARNRTHDMRRILQRGLEVIRGIGNHGMELALVAHLAKTFASKSLSKLEEGLEEEAKALEEQAAHYWKLVKSMLERPISPKKPLTPTRQLFCGSSNGTMMSAKEKRALKDEARMFQAVQAMNAGSLDEAEEMLSELTSAQAAFYTAQVIKKKCESFKRGEQGALMQREKAALRLALERGQCDPNWTLASTVRTQLKDLEKSLHSYYTSSGYHSDQVEDEESLGDGSSQPQSPDCSFVLSPQRSSTPKDAMQSTPRQPRGAAAAEVSADATKCVELQLHTLSLHQNMMSQLVLDQYKQQKVVIEQLTKRIDKIASEPSVAATSASNSQYQQENSGQLNGEEIASEPSVAARSATHSQQENSGHLNGSSSSHEGGYNSHCDYPSQEAAAADSMAPRVAAGLPPCTPASPSSQPTCGHSPANASHYIPRLSCPCASTPFHGEPPALHRHFQPLNSPQPAAAGVAVHGQLHPVELCTRCGPHSPQPPRDATEYGAPQAPAISLAAATTGTPQNFQHSLQTPATHMGPSPSRAEPGMMHAVPSSFTIPGSVATPPAVSCPPPSIPQPCGVPADMVPMQASVITENRAPFTAFQTTPGVAPRPAHGAPQAPAVPLAFATTGTPQNLQHGLQMPATHMGPSPTGAGPGMMQAVPSSFTIPGSVAAPPAVSCPPPSIPQPCGVPADMVPTQAPVIPENRAPFTAFQTTPGVAPRPAHGAPRAPAVSLDCATTGTPQNLQHGLQMPATHMGPSPTGAGPRMMQAVPSSFTIPGSVAAPPAVSCLPPSIPQPCGVPADMVPTQAPVIPENRAPFTAFQTTPGVAPGPAHGTPRAPAVSLDCATTGTPQNLQHGLQMPATHMGPSPTGAGPGMMQAVPSSFTIPGSVAAPPAVSCPPPSIPQPCGVPADMVPTQAPVIPENRAAFTAFQTTPGVAPRPAHGAPRAPAVSLDCATTGTPQNLQHGLQMPATHMGPSPTGAGPRMMQAVPSSFTIPGSVAAPPAVSCPPPSIPQPCGVPADMVPTQASVIPENRAPFTAFQTTPGVSPGPAHGTPQAPNVSLAPAATGTPPSAPHACQMPATCVHPSPTVPGPGVMQAAPSPFNFASTVAPTGASWSAASAPQLHGLSADTVPMPASGSPAKEAPFASINKITPGASPMLSVHQLPRPGTEKPRTAEAPVIPPQTAVTPVFSQIPLKELGKFNSCASSSSKTPTMTDKYKAGEPEITVKTKISASSTVQQLPNNISNQQPAGTEFRFGVGGSDQKPSTDRIMKLSNLDSQKVNGSASTDAELQTACSLPFQSHTAPPLTRPPYSAPAVSGERADSPQSQSEAPEEYVPNGEFEPVVELPKLIEVKTGEEDEEVLFCEQAKLYRYDAKAKEWKERGTGQLKILRHMKTKLCRVVMRRDHVLNLCANHNILPEMKLHPLSTRGHAWSWCACDYSEGKDCFEILAVRFKTQKQAEDFKEVFESCKDKVQSTVLQNNSERDRDAHEEQTEAPKSLPQSNQLKPEPRDCKCDNCGALYSPDETCTACEPFKVCTLTEKLSKLHELISETIESSGRHLSDDREFSFSDTSEGTSPKRCTSTAEPLKPPLRSMSPSPPALPAASMLETFTDMAPGTPASTTLTQRNSGLAEPCSVELYVQRVVSLPPSDGVESGEEEEVLLYQQAKLFDEEDKEWKDSGFNDIMLIRNRVTQQTRLVIGQEPASNFLLAPELQFNKKGDCTVEWPAKSFSDGIASSYLLALRFKNSEAADQFLDAMKLLRFPVSNLALSPVNARADHTSSETGLAASSSSGRGDPSCSNSNVAQSLFPNASPAKGAVSGAGGLQKNDKLRKERRDEEDMASDVASKKMEVDQLLISSRKWTRIWTRGTSDWCPLF